MIDAIIKRKSIRTYVAKPLSDDDEKKVIAIIKEINQMKGPFGHAIRLSYHPHAYVDQDAPVKIGTYGFIKNAPSFISGTVIHNFKGLIDFGYLFELLILRLTQLNLGTVWLAGTFHRSAFKHLILENELMPAITPIGYHGESPSMMDKWIRKRSKGDFRLPNENLFFNQQTQEPWVMGENMISKALELLRIAPSASNKQPWRVYVQSHALYLYLARTPNYARILNFDIQALDMGIALAHLIIGLNQDVSKPNIFIEDPNLNIEHQYIASIKL